MKAEDQRARAQAVPDRVGPDDPRYAALVGRGFNKRFAGKPDYVRLVRSTDDVIDAVQDAVRDGRRVVARGGGHCLEGFIDDPDVRVIIDTSLMTGVRYEPGMGAFEIDAGTTLGEAYRRLVLRVPKMVRLRQSDITAKSLTAVATRCHSARPSRPSSRT
jgi:FAD/FMN-containing dehydrogenase